MTSMDLHPTDPRARSCWSWILSGGAGQPIHTSKASRKAPAARAAWLTVEWLAKYAPELNAIEHCWHDLKGNFLAHQTFASAEELEAAIHQGVAQRNQERQSQMCSVLPKAA